MKGSSVVMGRWFGVLLAVLGLSGSALAAEPVMWGLGPRVGTHFLPGDYPLTFPSRIAEDAHLARVRQDLLLGAEGVYYVNRWSRIGLLGSVGFGAGYLDGHGIGKYDAVMNADAVEFLVGGGAGYGKATFRSHGEARLIMPYYPIRAHGSVQIRDQVRAYQVTLFGQYNLPARHTYIDAQGQEQDVGMGFYGRLGIEASMMFGDFVPPRPR